MSADTLFTADTLCPFSHRVQIVAAELDLDLDVVVGADIPVEVREVNASGTWPVLRPAGGGALIADSGAIVAHLLDAAGQAAEGFRSSPAHIAILDRLVRNMSRVIMAGKPPIQAEARRELDAALREVDALLAESGGPFLGGARFTQGDAHVAPFLHRMAFVREIRVWSPPALAESGRLQEWLSTVVTRPSFAPLKPPMKVLRAFYEERAKLGKPMKIGRLHHSAFRAMYDDLVARLDALRPPEADGDAAFADARGLAVLLFRTIALHGSFENRELFPALDVAHGAPLTTPAIDDHDHEGAVMDEILQLFDAAAQLPVGQRSLAIGAVAEAVRDNRAGFLDHLAYEEANFMPVLSALDLPTHTRLLRAAFLECLAERPYLIGPLVAYMPPENRLLFIHSFCQIVDPDHPQWRLIMGRIHQHQDGEGWLRIQRRFEDLIPAALAVLPPGTGKPCLAQAAAEVEAAFPLDSMRIERAPRDSGHAASERFEAAAH